MVPRALRRTGQEPTLRNASSSPLGSSYDPQVGIFAHLFPIRHRAPHGSFPGGLGVNVVSWPQGLSFRSLKTSFCPRAPSCDPIQKRESGLAPPSSCCSGVHTTLPSCSQPGSQSPTSPEIEQETPSSFGEPTV